MARSSVLMPPPLLYGASLWNRIQRTVARFAAFDLIVGLRDEELRRLDVRHGVGLRLEAELRDDRRT